LIKKEALSEIKEHSWTTMKQAEQIAKDLLTRQAGKKKKRVVSRVLDYSWATEKRAMSKEKIIDYMEKHGGGYYTNHRFGRYREVRKKA